jgi:Ferritin-like domain
MSGITKHGRTRAQAIRAAAVAATGAAAGAVASGWIGPASSAGQPSRAQDVRILNFLLVLEEAQVAFYTVALRSTVLGAELTRFARTVAPQERAHARVLRRRLGRDAQRPPTFDFADAAVDPKRFRDTAIDLEEATAAAYIGQGANLTRDAVALVASIVAVEARHAAWIRDIAGADPAPRAADVARSADDVLSELRRKGLLR